MEPTGRCSFYELLLGVSVCRSVTEIVLPAFPLSDPHHFISYKTTRNVTVFMQHGLSSN